MKKERSRNNKGKGEKKHIGVLVAPLCDKVDMFDVLEQDLLDFVFAADDLNDCHCLNYNYHKLYLHQPFFEEWILNLILIRIYYISQLLKSFECAIDGTCSILSCLKRFTLCQSH